MKYSLKNIGRGLLALALCSTAITGFAQSGNPLTQFSRMPFMYNPAVSGAENMTDVKVGTRYQWVGVDDAPKGYFLGANHSFQKEEGARTKVGVSGFLAQETVGNYRDMHASVSSAVHIPVSEKFFLSLGFQAGYNRISVNPNSMRPRDEQDSFYRSLMNSDGAISYVNVNPGIILHSDKLYLGYAPLSLIRTRVNDRLKTEEQHSIRHTTMLGYRFQLTDDLELMPSALVQMESNSKSIYNLNAKFRYRSQFWAGAGFSPDRAVSAIVGFSPSSRLNISYSYDKSIGGTNDFQFGSSHELVLGIPLFGGGSQPNLFW